MSAIPQENPEQNSEVQKKQNDAEYNFAQLRKKLEAEQQARMAAEERASQLEKMAQRRVETASDEDDDDGEPYVDRKRLKKEFNKVVPQIREDTKADVRQEVQKALQAERQQNWMKGNPDYYDVMQHAQRLADKEPGLAETILKMPESFERNQLVYNNIKALGLHKKEEPKESIQDVIDKNRRNPYYQPSGQGAPPYGVYSTTGRDVSPAEGQNAYAKMKELQSKLRL